MADQPFADRVAIVTGAGSGIGKATALELGAKGARLALVGRRTKPLEEVAATAQIAGAKARIYPTDVAQTDEIERLCDAIHRDFSRLDILVHSAGVHLRGPLSDAPAQEFDLHYRTNLLGPYLVTQGLLSLLVESQGEIVFINSSAGLTARAEVGQFAATKHGLKAVADSLRDEVNPRGVRVLSVYPGRTASPNQERLHALEGRTYRPEKLMQPEDVAGIVVHALTLPRTAEVTEIKIRPMIKFD